MPRDCPRCGEGLSSSTCQSCGWGTASKDAPVADFRCEWHSGGERCHYAGSMSESTVGGGPWYCGEHYFAMQREHAQSVGADIVERSKQAEPHPVYSYERRKLMALRAMAMRQKAWEELKRSGQ